MKGDRGESGQEHKPPGPQGQHEDALFCLYRATRVPAGCGGQPGPGYCRPQLQPHTCTTPWDPQLFVCRPHLSG